MRKLLLLSACMFVFTLAAAAQTGNASTTTASSGNQPSACSCQCNCPTNDASQCSCRCSCPNQAQATMSSNTAAPSSTASAAKAATGGTAAASSGEQGTVEYNDQQDAESEDEPADQSSSNEPVLQQRPPVPPASSIPAGSRVVPAGTELHATLDRLLSSKTAQAGDTFTATLSEPITARNGAVLLPIGTKLQGEVTDVEQGKVLASVRGKARLDLRFREVKLPNGTTLPITASLLGVNETGKKTGASSDSEGGVSGGTTGGRVVRDVGIGAGIGTVAGLIFGSALKGLAIGAIAGGGYVLATAGKDVELPAETGLRIQLDQNVPIPANAVNAR
jgi:hypothetical protein